MDMDASGPAAGGRHMLQFLVVLECNILKFSEPNSLRVFFD